jgi:hypothetical protein
MGSKPQGGRVKVLIINSYAGSIVLGAKSLGCCDIIGSYEDHNFGLDVQKANFPDLKYLEYRDQWPEQDLSDVLVVAHPPCSAFSLANTSPSTRGVNSGAFSCTKSVLQYAMGNNAIGIAIESVMGALGGAWPIHQHFADKYGYNLYRILENGCMFGAQWRERFWVLYVKKGAAPDTLQLALTPRWQTVRQAIQGHEEGPSPRNLDVLLERQKQRLLNNGITQAEVDMLFDPAHQPKKTTALGTLLWRMKFEGIPEEEKHKRYLAILGEDFIDHGLAKQEMFHIFIGGFASGQMCILGLDSLAPVLMGGSHWYCNGRNLAENGWKRIMGFPACYHFPETPRNYRKAIQTYLSKGVMPPIAEWVIEQAGAHLGMLPSDHVYRHHPMTPFTYIRNVEPNHIADFRIARSAWTPDLAYVPGTPLPPLRDMDEQPAPGPRFQGVGDMDFSPVPIPERKPKRVGRAPRPAGDGTPTPRVNKTARLEVATRDNINVHTVPQKKLLILDIIQGLGTPTWDEAVDACINNPDVGCAHASSYWHVRQLVKYGQLREVAS